VSVEADRAAARRNWTLVGGLLVLAVLIDVVRAVEGDDAKKRRRKR